MQKNQNNIIFTAIAVILVLIVAGTYIYYFVTPEKIDQNKPVPCKEGDRYNILTGDLCPSAPALATSTTEATI